MQLGRVLTGFTSPSEQLLLKSTLSALSATLISKVCLKAFGEIFPFLKKLFARQSNQISKNLRCGAPWVGLLSEAEAQFANLHLIEGA